MKIILTIWHFIGNSKTNKPVIVALPFKIMLFVLVDGWNLLIGSLVLSFGQ